MIEETIGVLVGTRKGAWIYRADSRRTGWRVEGPHFLGHVVNHLVIDPRDGKTLLMAAKTGHLGPTVFRSDDFGRTWREAIEPPAFRKAVGDEPEASLTDRARWARSKVSAPPTEPALAVDHTFALSPGHASEPGVWYAGTSPIGLFRSEDGGARWHPVAGFNDHPMRFRWAPQGDETPDGPILHSILVDPRDASHLCLNLSGGGTFESTDRGDSWQPLNEGVEANFMPDPYPEYGQDPHCVMLHAMKPDRLYQANHCGIYRLDRPSRRWERIGRNMPADVGDIGFPIVLHPRDPETAWVFPMDGTTVWPRTSPGGRPAAYRTRDGGSTWQRQDRGLPSEQGWFTVKRQAFSCDACDPVGLYFGTTGGEIWRSANEGDEWALLAAHLPEIYSVTTAVLA